jgi:hypothetical protein
MTRMIAMLTRPPRNPAVTPSVPPISSAQMTGVTPMNSDSRPP